jgi:beta-1,4-N-acetylglucosaminyltransferase
MLSLLRTLDPFSYTHRSYLISSGDDFSAQKAIEFESHLLEQVKKGRREAGRKDDEEAWGVKGCFYGSYDLAFVLRARKIHQSLLTTPFSALRCLIACFSVLRSPNLPPSSVAFPPLPPPTRSYPPPNRLAQQPQEIPERSPTQHTYPHLILTNGPATATTLILAAVILRFLLDPLPVIPNPLSAFLPSTHGKLRTIYVESFARVRRMSLSGRIVATCGMCERVMVQWEGLASPGVGLGDTGWGRREFRGVLVE